MRAELTPMCQGLPDKTHAHCWPQLHPGHSQWRISVVDKTHLLTRNDALEQNMFAHMHITADGRFLEFNVGDWSMLVGGFTLVGLLVWLI